MSKIKSNYRISLNWTFWFFNGSFFNQYLPNGILRYLQITSHFDQAASLLFEPFRLMLLFFSSTCLTSGYAASITVTSDGTRHKRFIHVYTLGALTIATCGFPAKYKTTTLSRLSSITTFFSKQFPPKCFCKLVNNIISCYWNKSVSCRTSGLEMAAV